MFFKITDFGIFMFFKKKKKEIDIDSINKLISTFCINYAYLVFISKKYVEIRINQKTIEKILYSQLHFEENKSI